MAAIMRINFFVTIFDSKKLIQLALKMKSEEAKRYLLGIFNEVVSLGMIPGSWLRTKVVPILKPRKDPDLSDSYRPISLLPCALKLLEKMLCTHLDYWAEKYDV
jgi:hypothetical protein